MSACFTPDYPIIENGLICRARGTGNQLKALNVHKTYSNFLSKDINFIGAGAACVAVAERPLSRV